MGRIVISTNATLDGFVQDPDGQEGTKQGGWFKQLVGNDLDAWYQVTTADALRAQALLIGRRTDAWFGSRSATQNNEWERRMNSLPKYVVSSTLAVPVWSNATVLKGDVISEASKLKQNIDGDILVYGSYQLGHALMENDLVDELRLVLFPAVLGQGERLFGRTSDKRRLRLVETRTLGEGLAFVRYERFLGA